MIEQQLIERAKKIVLCLGKARLDDMLYCHKSTMWQINQFIQMAGDKSEIEKILYAKFGRHTNIHFEKFVARKTDRDIYWVAGNFRICREEHIDTDSIYGYLGDIVVVFHNGKTEVVVLHGNWNEPIMRIVNSDEDHSKMLTESEIIYIEIDHNICEWHCLDYSPRERITLTAVEKELSESFYRISRSYIVNIKHVHGFGKNEIIMDNGDVLQVPYRKFPKVKRDIHRLLQNG